MATQACITKQAKGLGFFERYLTIQERFLHILTPITIIFGLGSGAALATVVGVLIEQAPPNAMVP